MRYYILIKKCDFWDTLWRAESILIGSKEMGNNSGQIPEAEVQSDNIMEQNTDRGGDLEVEDDGPY